MVNYRLDYRTSETRMKTNLFRIEVNYCVNNGRAETRATACTRLSQVNYYLDYRTSETMTPLRVGGAR